VKVPKEQRSRASNQGILGVVARVSEQYSIVVATEFGVIASGNPKKPHWLSVDNYEVKSNSATMMRKPLVTKYNEIVVGRFNVYQEKMISLKEAHILMLGHKFTGLKICKCKNGCNKKSCSCRQNGSVCGSGCGCGGTCSHSNQLSMKADDDLLSKNDEL
jgi:hypothetical protein